METPRLPLPDDERGHSWPDVAVIMIKHPFTALFIGVTALILSAACQLGYHLPFNDMPVGHAYAHEATPEGEP